jgi:hypothetical protein
MNGIAPHDATGSPEKAGGAVSVDPVLGDVFPAAGGSLHPAGKVTCYLREMERAMYQK